jgi:hypothetical protein
MAKGNPSKSIMILSAPKGTILEALQSEDQGGCQLVMDSTGKGEIKVYTCDT